MKCDKEEKTDIILFLFLKNKALPWNQHFKTRIKMLNFLDWCFQYLPETLLNEDVQSHGSNTLGS